MGIFEWRRFLYQRVRDDVDRLHQDIITLRRQFELDELHNICFCRPIITDQYKVKLELLKQELNSFERACYKNCEERTQNNVSHTVEFLEIQERFERLGRMEDMLPNIIEWQKKCSREFQQWLQSTDLYELELCNRKIAYYKHIKVQTRDQAEREARRKHRIKEQGGTWMWPIYGIPDLKIECSYMQPLQTSEMTEGWISETEELETADMTDELQTSDISRRISETQELETQGVTDSMVSETGELQTSDISRRISETQGMTGSMVSETQELETQGMPASIISETHVMPASIISETQDMSASIISETQDMPASIISETQDMPASIISDTQDMPASIISDTQDMPASIISETHDMPASIISETWDMPASIIQTQLGTIISEIQKLQSPGYMCNIMFKERQKLWMMDSRQGSVNSKLQAFE